MSLDKTILVPLDQSALAAAAVPYAAAVAKATGSRLLLFSVIQARLDEILARRFETDTELNRQRREAAELYLAGTATSLRERGYDVATRAVMGEPVEEILSAADSESVAMVVMATHGRGGVERWVIGSVADKVMRLGHKPTLLMRPEGTADIDRELTLSRILVPLDGSLLAEAALAPATELALAAQAHLVLLRVQPPFSTAFVYDQYIPDLAEVEDEAFGDARNYLESVKLRMPAGLDAQAIALRGIVAMTIQDYVGHHSMSLVVMSTRGQSGLTRLVLGSTADHLVRSGVPTLLVRPKSGDSAAVPQPAEGTAVT